MKRKIAGIIGMLFIVVALVLTGCTALPFTTQNGAESSDSQSIAQEPAGMTAATGKLEIRVTDAPAKEEITGITVKVDSIQIHKAVSGESGQEPQPENTSEGIQEEDDGSVGSGGWIPLDLTDNEEFDLFQVKDTPKTLSLNLTEIGKYTQIRMAVDS
jgi:hypothetical protein